MKGLARDLKKIYTNPVQCSKCSAAGGTLVKIDNHYQHQDRGLCRIMQQRTKKK